MIVCYHKLWKMLMDRNMSKSELVKATGINVDSIFSLEDNEAISYVELRKISAFFNCDVKDILVCDQAIKSEFKNFKAIELFAGAGGLALGIEKGGFEFLGLIESDRAASLTLTANRPKWRVITDDIANISRLDLENYFGVKRGELDLLSGGVPHESFPRVDKSSDLEEVRETLFYHYAKFLEKLRPKMFLLESPRALARSNSGRIYRTIRQVLEDLGYITNKWVFNAWDYGVAQNKDCLFTIGIRRDLGHKKLIEPPAPYQYKPVLRDILLDCPMDDGALYTEHKQKLFELIPPGGNWESLPEDIAKEYLKNCWDKPGSRPGILRRLSLDEPSLPVIGGQRQQSGPYCHPLVTRPLSIRESARCQSFPDEWYFYGKRRQRYKQVDSATPVNLAYEIALKIRDTLSEI